jgi:hypothetical protein
MPRRHKQIQNKKQQKLNRYLACGFTAGSVAEEAK